MDGERATLLGCLDVERGLEIGDEVVRVLETHGQAHHLGRDARLGLRLGIELRVCSRSRVDRERLGVADVGHVREDGQALDEPLAGGDAVLDAKDDHRTTLALEVRLLEIVELVALEARVLDPSDLRMGLEELGDGERIRAVLLHAQRQSLDALHEHPRVVGRDARAQIAQRHGAHAQDERERQQHRR